MITQISTPIEPITIHIPQGTTEGFANSIFPWHRLGASNQTKGDAGVTVVCACMKAAGLSPQKINGEGDILTQSKSEVKYARETINHRTNGVALYWRWNGIRPLEKAWQYIYLVVEQGDHADNTWLVLEFDRETMLNIVDDGIISMYGQPGAQLSEDSEANVVELRAHKNSRTDHITEYLIPKALNVVHVPQSLFEISMDPQ